MNTKMIAGCFLDFKLTLISKLLVKKFQSKGNAIKRMNNFLFRSYHVKVACCQLPPAYQNRIGIFSFGANRDL